jgi:OOP family OmpA-OmpF porin
MLEEQVSVQLDIQFEIEKADIQPQFHRQLKEVADFLITYANTSAVIEGHTDNVGEADYNKDLSQRRAESVRDYLIDNFGIDPNRLTARGYGEEKPVASNDTARGRAQNRRVVAVISAEKQTYQKK